nr:SH3 domain-containing protein [uncultured Amphritea sp.]
MDSEKDKVIDSDVLRHSSIDMLRAMEQLTNSSAMQFTQQLANSPATKLAQQLADSPTMRLAQQLADSPTMRLAQSYNDFQQTALKMQNLSAKALRHFNSIHTMGHAHAQRFHDATLSAMKAYNFPALKALSNLNKSETMSAVQQLLKMHDTSVLSKLHHIDSSALEAALNGAISSDEFFGVVDAEIQDELSTIGKLDFDFAKLSDKGQKVAVHLLTNVIWPLLIYFYLIPVIEEMMSDVEPSLLKSDTVQEVKKKSRCLDSDAISLLHSCRFVIGNRLRLRESASRKAEVIAYLPLGKIVNVLDSSNRSWLEVEVLIDGDYLIGWVARRYTSSF